MRAEPGAQHSPHPLPPAPLEAGVAVDSGSGLVEDRLKAVSGGCREPRASVLCGWVAKGLSEG